MKRQDDLLKVAETIVADRELITRRLVVRASAVIIAFELLIAVGLGVALWKNHELARDSECHVLEHRTSTRTADITEIENQVVILRALKELGEGAADPDDLTLQSAVRNIRPGLIEVPEPDEATLGEYMKKCR